MGSFLYIPVFLLTPFWHPGAGGATTYSERRQGVVELLGRVEFCQCIIFTNSASTASKLARQLSAEGWPSLSVFGAMEQVTAGGGGDEL